MDSGIMNTRKQILMFPFKEKISKIWYRGIYSSENRENIHLQIDTMKI